MVTFNTDSLDFVDDEEARFGAGADFSARYSSSNNRLELEDLNAGTVGYIPQDISTDLVGGKFAETVSEGKALSDNGQVYNSIQAAVDNASSWVKVGPGDFRESVTIDTAGLTLEGSGERTVIDGGDSYGVFFTTSELTLNNFSVRSDESFGVREESGSNATGVLVHNVTVITSGSNALSLDFGDGHIITNCTVKETTDNHGIIVPTNGVVTNCTVKNISQKGIIVNNDDSIAVGNIVENTGEFGIRLSGVNDSLVGANRVIRAGQDGISNSGNDNIIFNNRISNSGGTAINDGGDGTVLDANLTT